MPTGPLPTVIVPVIVDPWTTDTVANWLLVTYSVPEVGTR